MMALVFLILIPGQIETVASTDFSKELQQSAVMATVRIENGVQHSTGSGVIVGQNRSYVYILTANHVVKNAKTLEIQTFSATSYPRPHSIYPGAEVIARMQDVNNDLALVRLATHDPMPATLPICPPRLVPEDQGFTGLSVGCSKGAPPTCRLDRINGKKRVRKPGEEGAAYFWQASKKTIGGRSGGPLLDQHGYVIGICSGSNDDEGYYSHISEIHRFLKKNGWKELYEEEP